MGKVLGKSVTGGSLSFFAIVTGPSDAKAQSGQRPLGSGEWIGERNSSLGAQSGRPGASNDNECMPCRFLRFAAIVCLEPGVTGSRSDNSVAARGSVELSELCDYKVRCPSKP